MDRVDLSFHYTEQDYVRAMRSHYRRRLRLPLDIAVIVIGSAIAAYQFRSGSQWLGTAVIALCALFAAILVAAFTVIPRIAFRRQPKFRDDYSLSFSEQGIHFRTTHIDSELQWAMYSHALVDAHSFILYYGPNQFSVIPRRVFQDDRQRQTFERLLAQHVAKVLDRNK